MPLQMLRRYLSLTAVTALLVALGMLLASGTVAQYPGYTYPPSQTQPPASSSSGTTSNAKAGSNSVTIVGDYISGYKFSPKKLTISAGKKVTWSWSSDDHHNVTFKTPNKHSKTSANVQDQVQEPGHLQVPLHHPRVQGQDRRPLRTATAAQLSAGASGSRASAASMSVSENSTSSNDPER